MDDDGRPCWAKVVCAAWTARVFGPSVAMGGLVGGGTVGAQDGNRRLRSVFPGDFLTLWPGESADTCRQLIEASGGVVPPGAPDGTPVTLITVSWNDSDRFFELQVPRRDPAASATLPQDAPAAPSSPAAVQVDGAPVVPGRKVALTSASKIGVGPLEFTFLAPAGATNMAVTRKRRATARGDDGAPSKVPRLQFPLEEECASLVERLMQFKDAWPFLEPVDAEALGIPEYLEIIEKPMDLGSVQAKFAEGAYSDVEGVRSDLQLVWDNAKTFNPPGDPIHNLALAMEKRFLRLWTVLTMTRRAPAASSSSSLAPPASRARGPPVRTDAEAEVSFINRFGLWGETTTDIAEEVGAVVGRRDGSARVVRKHALPALPPGSKYFKPSNLDVSGLPLMPIRTKHLTVLSLGKIDQRSGFHSKRYLWPIGFRSQREGPSYKRPGRRTLYTQEIMDDVAEPKFRVAAGDDPDGAITHASATGAWRDILDRVKLASGTAAKGVSGPEQFGFVHPNVLVYIQQLPGASNCRKYEPTSFTVKPS